MPALTAFAAVLTGTHMNVELSVNCSDLDLGLILRLDTRFNDLAPAVRAALWQVGFICFVDLIRRRRLAASVPAVLLARFTSWAFRPGFGRTLGKGSGLPLAGAKRCLQLFAQSINLRLQSLDSLLQPGN